MKKKVNPLYDNPPIYHINHVYESALYAARATELDAGINIIKNGLANWPEIRDREVNKLIKEMTR